jgi:hypothetical protein
MTTRNISDKIIAAANKVFTLIEATEIKIKEVEAYAEERQLYLIKEANTMSQEWQLVGYTAINGGFKLASKQQDIIEDSLRSIKNEVSNGYSRSAHLINNSK